MKTATALEAAWSAVVTTDPAELDRNAVADLLRSIASVRSACDAAEVLAVRRTRELNSVGSAEPAEHLLANQTGRSSKQAREAAAREEACTAMPGLEAGLAKGTMSTGHLDAAAAVHAKLNDEVAQEFAAHAEALVARSQQLGVDAFDRECRDLARHLTAVNDPNAEVDELERQKAASSVKRWVDKTTGMHNTLLSLDPIRDAKMWKVINNQVGRERQQRKVDGEPPLPFTALQAQAVVTAVTHTPTADTPSPTADTPSPSAPAGPSTHTSLPSTKSALPSTSPVANPTQHPGTSPGAATADTSNSSARPFDSDASPPAQHDLSVPVGNDLINIATPPAPAGPAPTRPTSAAAIRLPEISIHCDLDTLINGIRSAGGVCETDDGVAIPPTTVRRLACDAKIIPMLLGSTGEVLDQGRRVRTATPAQRNTLAAMHCTCAFPGCTVRFSDTRIHHIRWWWEHLGPTDIVNLLPLCENHHHLVHEGGWVLTLDADRTATWTRPDGELHYQGTTINR